LNSIPGAARNAKLVDAKKIIKQIGERKLRMAAPPIFFETEKNVNERMKCQIPNEPTARYVRPLHLFEYRT
jgi:hypothetical protein